MSRIILPRRDLMLPSRRLQRGSMVLDAYRFGAPTDPYWANVVAQLNMGGSDEDPTFTDDTGRIWTASGDAQIDTSLGYNAGLFDGAGDRVTTPYVKASFDWWTSDYTIEAWLKINTLSAWYYVDGANKPAMIGCADPASGTNYWSFGPNFNNDLAFYYYNGGAVQVYHTGPATGALAHIAMCKTSGGIRLATNGSVSGLTGISGTPQSSATSPVVLTLGQINNRSINGWVKALRITKGVARYTANFTPPSAPFPTS